MAKLLKERARKPLIENGGAVASQTYQYGEPGYVLDVHQQHPGPTYTLRLTRKEMLKAVSTWMAAEARFADQDISVQGRK